MTQHMTAILQYHTIFIVTTYVAKHEPHARIVGYLGGCCIRDFLFLDICYNGLMHGSHERC
jgi:hypothetical protein